MCLDFVLQCWQAILFQIFHRNTSLPKSDSLVMAHITLMFGEDAEK